MIFFLATEFFQFSDIWFFPLCLVLLWAIVKWRASLQNDPVVKRIYFKGFYFKIATTLLFTFVSALFFHGGDTALYYQGILDMRAAIRDHPELIWQVFTTHHLTPDNPFAAYFYYDNYLDDITYNYMESAGNLFMPRLGVFPSFLFDKSYLCICMFFSFFALGGSLRLYKFFYHYYPTYHKEIAIATIFIPSVGFWSGGLLKDTICFACVGFFVFAVFNLLVKRRKIFSSIMWIIITGYLLYTIKVYIFLVLLMAMMLWIFTELNKLIPQRHYRFLFSIFTLGIGAYISYYFYLRITSAEDLKQYQLENIVTSADYYRSGFKAIADTRGDSGSYYFIDTSNTFLWIINSIGATFFRPFLWELSSATSFLSAIEALLFTILFIYYFVKKGVIQFFKIVLFDNRLLFSFVFALILGIAVGASTANFGALSRYKIPAMPFFAIVLLLVYRKSSLPFPAWFRTITGLKNNS